MSWTRRQAKSHSIECFGSKSLKYLKPKESATNIIKT